MSSTMLVLLCRKVNSRTRSPTLTASSTRADMMRGVDTETSTPHDSLNSHSLLGWLTRPTVRGTANSVLASSEITRLALSSPVEAMTTSQRCKAGLVEGRQLAGVGEQPFGVRHAVGLDRPWVLVDEQHLVAVLEQLGGDRATDGAGSGDRDAHQCSSGPLSMAAETTAASASGMTRWSMSPSWKTRFGAGHHRLAEPGEERDLGADLLEGPDLAADPGVGHLGSTSIRISPDASRHSGSEPSGSSRRSIWSAVQRTVATVGMPSRW